MAYLHVATLCDNDNVFLSSSMTPWCFIVQYVDMTDRISIMYYYVRYVVVMWCSCSCFVYRCVYVSTGEFVRKSTFFSAWLYAWWACSSACCRFSGDLWAENWPLLSIQPATHHEREPDTDAAASSGPHPPVLQHAQYIIHCTRERF